MLEFLFSFNIVKICSSLSFLFLLLSFKKLKLLNNSIKSQIVRKKRSKSIYVSSGKKLKSSKPESSEAVSEITTEASSCFSSGSSSNTAAADKPRKPAMPSHMGHKAAAIMRVLSNGSTSEVIIRQVLGDSPSTSKALRM